MLRSPERAADPDHPAECGAALAPGIEGGIESSSLHQKLGKPVQGADRVAGPRERFAKLPFRLGRVRQRRTERATCLQQRWIVLQSQRNSLIAAVGLLLALANQPKIEMRFSRVRLQLQSLFEGCDSTFEIALFGRTRRLSRRRFLRVACRPGHEKPMPEACRWPAIAPGLLAAVNSSKSAATKKRPAIDGYYSVNLPTSLATFIASDQRWLGDDHQDSIRGDVA